MLGLRLPFLSVLLLFCVVFSSCFFMINALVVGLAACHPDQIKSLMQFKNEFESTSCNQSDYFNAVMCDNSTGAVTKLNLPSGCLSGILKPNSSLFGLHHLRYLNLSYNDFTSSSISARFGNLNRLEVLSLSSNGFIGQVPSSFSNLSRLDLLDLSLNHLTGSFPLLRNLTNLSILDLSYNHFTGTLSPSSSLFELYYLRYLDLSYNNFISSPLSSHFSNLNRLEVFSLAYNHFSGIIPSSLFMMPFLSSIYLDGNKFTGPIEVPNSSLSSRLETLSLGYNQFEGQILEPISNLITLKVLDLQSCQISHFPNFLKNLQKLEHIELSNNKLKGKIPKWLWTLPRLTIVSLVNNSFTDLEGSEEVLVNSPVRILDLALNHFKGPFPKPPLSINVLSIWNNSFTGNIPLETCNRTSLTILDLSYNNFTGPIPSCLSNITIVNLRRNNFEGSLPDMFHDGALLRTLDVGYNQLTGKLPRSLLNCSLLKFLSLDHNRLRDTFPFWIKALPDLQALTLRSNKFYGPMSLPGEGPLAFPKLRILEISDNNFTGSLPSNYFVNWEASSPQMDENGRIYMGVYSIPSYTYEDTIDLQYKGLFMEQGKILTSYATIDFSRNKLEGQIPESIGHLKSLIALNLSNNAFTGHIPPSLENVTELESLDLSRNQLSGTIPNGLKTLSFLAYISVAHNQLKGEIPQGTQITGQSKSSFEGNAGLCGLPLEETCFGSKVPATQPPEEDDEHVLNWKAVAIAYGPGMLLGLAIGQVIGTYKSEWLLKIFGRYKRWNR